jgi:hypothetical protein
MIPESSSTAAVAMPVAAVLLTPLDIARTNGYGRITTPWPSNLGAAANWNNAVTLVGISSVILGPFGPTKFVGNAGGFQAMDRTLTLAGRGIAQFPPFRAIPGPGNHSGATIPEAELSSIVEEPGAAGLAVPPPQRSDVITDFMPFDLAAIGKTIDQFLQQLGDFGAGLSWFQGPTDLFVKLLAVTAALTAWKAVPTIVGHARDDDQLAAADPATSLDGIFGLPGGSSTEDV